MGNSNEDNLSFVKLNKESDDKSDFICPNKSCFINEFCSLDWKKMLYKKRQILYFKKKNYIFREGELIHGINIIFEGKVKIHKSDASGNGVIVHLAKEGELIEPESVELSNHFHSAISIEDTTVCFIDKETFLLALKSNINLTYHMFLFYLKELNNLENKLRVMSNNKSSVRIAEILLNLDRILSKESRFIELNSAFSRSDIASMSGISYESVIRTLKRFENLNLISVDNNKIALINPDRLKELIRHAFN